MDSDKLIVSTRSKSEDSAGSATNFVYYLFVIMHDLVYPTPKNLLETLFDLRRTILATVFSLTATQRGFCIRQKVWGTYKKFSTATGYVDYFRCRVGPHGSFPVVPFRVCPNCVLGVSVFIRKTEVRRLAGESFRPNSSVPGFVSVDKPC